MRVVLFVFGTLQKQIQLKFKVKKIVYDKSVFMNSQCHSF
jgi:hypothetical protein